MVVGVEECLVKITADGNEAGVVTDEISEKLLGPAELNANTLKSYAVAGVKFLTSHCKSKPSNTGSNVFSGSIL